MPSSSERHRIIKRDTTDRSKHGFMSPPTVGRGCNNGHRDVMAVHVAEIAAVQSWSSWLSCVRMSRERDALMLRCESVMLSAAAAAQ